MTRPTEPCSDCGAQAEAHPLYATLCDDCLSGQEWPTSEPDDTAYRRQMQDAGRGRLLG